MGIENREIQSSLEIRMCFLKEVYKCKHENWHALFRLTEGCFRQSQPDGLKLRSERV
jgi:hypothetical protein